MKTLFTFILLSLVSGVCAAEKQTVASVEPLYRAHRFATTPTQNPATRFLIEELEVPGLWAALEVQVFNVHHVTTGQPIPRNPFLCHGGKIHPLVDTTGGQGLMSAVVAERTLYFTNGHGSGIHRSEVGRLQIVNGAPQLTASASFYKGDLFVEKTPDGRVRVIVGSWRGFNRYEAGVPLGWVALQSEARLSIMDDAGQEVSLGQR